MARSSVIVVEVTIVINTAVSTGVDFSGRRLAGVIGPAAWTAGDITFEIWEPAGAAWRKVVDASGALVKITGVATALAEYMIPPEIADRFMGPNLRIVSTNTASEVDVNQDAARTLYVVLEEMG